MNPIQPDYLERHEEHLVKIMTCAEFESNIVERQMEEFAQPYPEEQDPHYYSAMIQGHQPQYFAQGHIYDGSPQEVHISFTYRIIIMLLYFYGRLYF